MRPFFKLKSTLSCLIVLSFLLSTVEAAPVALIQPSQAESIYRHLLELHWTPETGLFRSFPDSTDQKLSQQASTYEQAAIGLLSLRFGDMERADPLYQFFKKTWDEGPQLPGPRAGIRGYANFYNAYFGSEGIEKTIHAGPNAWIGLFAAKYGNATKRRDALQLALDIQYWMANQLPHDRGGIAMGLRNDPYGATWSKIYSTENNLSYYAFLTELLRSTAIDKTQRVAITSERDRVENWLLKVAFDSSSQMMLRGLNPGGKDATLALDTITWLISAVGPRRMAERGVNPHALMEKAAHEFEVTIGARHGVDPAGQDEANLVYADLRSRLNEINRPTEDGHRVIWYEGLGQYILALSTLADYSQNTADQDKAQAYLEKAQALTAEYDAASLKRFGRGQAFPYATPGKFFRYGWGAPQEAEEGPASSLIAGVWRCYVGLDLDPLAGRSLGTIENIEVSTPKALHLAERKPVVLYGTSEDMTTEAWRALKNEEWDHAIRQAKATIAEWSTAARYLQKMKQTEVGGLVEYSGRAEEKTKAFKYWALNDVGAAYFILGQALDHQKDYANASRAFQQIVNQYSLAQIWDPKGWFWSPVQAITDDYVLRDRAHYGWVLPQTFAEGSRTGKTPY